MKYKYFFLLISVLITTNFLYSQENKMNKIDETINKIKNKFVPDKRIAIFDVKTETSGDTILLTGETTEKEVLEKLLQEINNSEQHVKSAVKILPEKKLGTKHYGIINLSVVNMRSKPSHPSELATQTLLGTCVNVFKENDGWYLVQTPDKYISWLDNDALVIADENEMNKWKQSEKIIYTKSCGSVYSQPDVTSQKVSDIVLGDILKFLQDENDFVKVEFPDGRNGYVEKHKCEKFSEWKNDTAATGNKIVETAKEFLGLPYLWGGTSAKGFDCSGFTKTVYFMHGVILPRDASQQVLAGNLVDTQNNFDKLQPGDLLFFGKKKTATEKERVTHVAIYIGNGKYIHAAGRVKINSLIKDSNDFNEYRYNTFIRAKRYLDGYNRNENLVKNNEFYN